MQNINENCLHRHQIETRTPTKSSSKRLNIFSQFSPSHSRERTKQVVAAHALIKSGTLNKVSIHCLTFTNLTIVLTILGYLMYHYLSKSKSVTKNAFESVPTLYRQRNDTVVWLKRQPNNTIDNLSTLYQCYNYTIAKL